MNSYEFNESPLDLQVALFSVFFAGMDRSVPWLVGQWPSQKKGFKTGDRSLSSRSLESWFREITVQTAAMIIHNIEISYVNWMSCKIPHGSLQRINMKWVIWKVVP